MLKRGWQADVPVLFTSGGAGPHADVALQRKLCLSVTMITVLIRVRGDDAALLDTLSALVPGVADGLVREALLLADVETAFLRTVADASGASLVAAADSDLGRTAAAAARSPWLLALQAGFVPGGLWMDDVADAVRESRVSAFTLRARRGAGPALRAAALNTILSTLGRPHPEQGLLWPRELALRDAPLPRVHRLASPLHDRRETRARL